MKKINLSDIPKQDPFVVPEGYLQNLPLQIQARVQQKPESLWRNVKGLFLLPQLQAAFGILIVIVVFGMIFLNTTTTPEQGAENILQEASRQELVNYLSQHNSFSVRELAMEGSWDDELITTQMAAEKDLEEEIIQNIDSYSAEELWK